MAIKNLGFQIETATYTPTLSYPQMANYSLAYLLDATIRVKKLNWVGHDYEEDFELQDLLPDGNSTFNVILNGTKQINLIKVSDLSNIYMDNIGGVVDFVFQYRFASGISGLRFFTLHIEQPAYGITNVNCILTNGRRFPYGTLLTKSLFDGEITFRNIGAQVGTYPLSYFDFDILYNGEVVEDSEVSVIDANANIGLKITDVKSPYSSFPQFQNLFNNAIEYKQENLNFILTKDFIVYDDEITGIELNNEVSLIVNNTLRKIKDTLFTINLANGTSVIKSLGDLTNNFFRISIDDGSFVDGSLVFVDPLDPHPTYDEYDDYSFLYVRTQEHDGFANISINFNYHDDNADEDKEFTFTFQATVHGITRTITRVLSGYYQVVGTEITKQDLIVEAYDGSALVKELENEEYELGELDYTTKGIKQLEISVLSGTSADYQEETIEFAYYEETPSQLALEYSKSNYSVGQRFNYNDFRVELRYNIDSTYDYKSTTTNVSCSLPNGYVFKASDIGQKAITITSNQYPSLMVAYFTQVLANTTHELWSFDKTTLIKQVYGEYELSFNMSRTLDQTSDSAKVIVYNYNKEQLKPNTIVYLPDTDTWWVVKKCSSTRYANENSNGLWEHEIDLVGAFDILVNRDMTNHGYNKDRYTLETMLNRLVSMTDFELPIDFDFTYFNKDTKIGYIKAFENYAPSTAIKEILNGINAIPKMRFTISGNSLSKATITILPKSGINNAPIDLSYFDDEEEVKVIEKNNYGSRVVSNIQNCVNSDLVRYPANGSILPVSDEEQATPDNAYLQLPQKADYVKSLIFFGLGGFSIFASNGTIVVPAVSNFKADNTKVIEIELEKAITSAILEGGTIPQEILDEIEEKKDQVINAIQKIASYELDTDTIMENVNTREQGKIGIAFGDKLFYNTYKMPKHCIYWEQGSDKIKNFTFHKTMNTILGKYNEVATTAMGATVTSKTQDREVHFDTFYIIGSFASENAFSVKPLSYAVVYRPQVSIKLKTENDELGNDTHIYNQNGKLTDSRAVSKLINSHSKEISSVEITRYKHYNNFFDIPEIGSVFIDNGEEYIVNNISYDFYQNDDYSYFIKCEFTLTKAIACKSTLVSADNNVRDYECPQNYNIKREQLYRDYYELDYTLDNQTTPYMVDFEKLFIANENQYSNVESYIAFIRSKNNNYNDYLYHKLETTTFSLAKSKYVIVDFPDNNIIGYSKATGSIFVFDIFKLFSVEKFYNVPISYVDSYGELNSIDIALLNEKKYGDICYNYLDSGNKDKIAYFGYSPLIASSMYDSAVTSGVSALIEEPNYKKDGLEKPVFELIEELGGSNSIVIGDDVFRSIKVDNDSERVIYTFVVSENRVEDYRLPNIADIGYNSSYYYVTNEFVMNFTKSTRKLALKLYLYSILPVGSSSPSRTLYNESILGKNISFFAVKVRNGVIVTKQFIFGVNNCRVEKDSNNELVLYVNNYKLK